MHTYCINIYILKAITWENNYLDVVSKQETQKSQFLAISLIHPQKELQHSIVCWQGKTRGPVALKHKPSEYIQLTSVSLYILTEPEYNSWLGIILYISSS